MPIRHAIAFEVAQQSPPEDAKGLSRFSLVATVSMTYPNKAAKLGMLEKLGDNHGFKLVRILHDKGFAVFGPSRNRRITCIYHMIRFCAPQTTISRKEKEKQAR